jgi:DNA-binding IclR family transcriptional regulator
VSILDLLAARPQESFGLSELARLLRLNKATCLMVLTTLTSSGYVLQDPSTKSYSLGPAAVAIGNAALTRFPAMEPARAVLRELSEEFGLVSLASAATAQQIVILAAFGIPGPLEPPSEVGMRLPFAPPYGTSLIAWMGGAEYEQWLSRAEPAPSPSELRNIERAIVAARSAGYAVGLRTRAERGIGDLMRTVDENPNRAFEKVMDEVTHAVRSEPEPYMLVDIEPSARYPVVRITTPVFGPDGRPVLTLALRGFHGDTTGDEVQRIGARIVDAAQTVTEQIGGRYPVLRADSGIVSAREQDSALS